MPIEPEAAGWLDTTPRKSTRWLLGVIGVGIALTVFVNVLAALRFNFDSVLPRRAYLVLHIVGVILFV
ncbi:MAG: hypothetical protein ACYDAG_00250, partial [Chloroflexota bacterium]